MTSRNSEVENLAEDLDKWKGIAPELELTPDEEQARRASQTTLVGKIISNKAIRLGVVRLILRRAWWNVKGFTVDALTLIYGFVTLTLIYLNLFYYSFSFF